MSDTTDMRDLYLAAERDCLQHGVTNRFAERNLETPPLTEIIAGRKEWEARAAAEARASSGTGSLSIRTATFR